ncbi:hypothetical protein BN159_8238 [Streptomyces davaonensis JCM 4913]|uniref:Uncharacterized protein n=1 Tax=Streptomyces davaonensis (strain DSM 101723 / JCM 4913 / KCC S-0913 / 768) TaxID=1214101 RepID=K4R8J4_STRDJ|nr:hypothetical protein BN159_8238 [Streptomyces davaonensis JCM 4913]
MDDEGRRTERRHPSSNPRNPFAENSYAMENR